MNPKETLEEAAEKYADFSNDYVPLAFGSKFNETTKRDFIEGGLWMQERMYSLDEIKDAMKNGYGIKYFSEDKFLKNLNNLKKKQHYEQIQHNIKKCNQRHNWWNDRHYNRTVIKKHILK